MSSASGGEGRPGLPWRCLVVLPGLPAAANVAVCERGIDGVRLTSIDLGEFTTARRLLRALNQAIGIDAAAEHAMLVGCLRGWNRDAAGAGRPRVTDTDSMPADWRAAGEGVLH